MKPIKLTQNDKNKLIEQFTNWLNENNSIKESKLHFTTDLIDATQEEKAIIHISTKAYCKMMLYVRDTDTEIAWHGTVTRNDNQYYIEDVFLYPQIVRAATVETDQEKYQDWIINLDDETANKLRFQGHSHVNMKTTPSGTDLNFYSDIVDTLQPNDYYIFIIMNKSGDMTFLIYDLAKNRIYENENILYRIGDLDNTTNIIKEIKLQKEEYCEKPTPITTGTTVKSYSDYYGNSDYWANFKDDTPTWEKYLNGLDKVNKRKKK